MLYTPQLIEPKWQKFWEDTRVFQAKSDGQKPKYYSLDMFPYPSGAGLHVGHVLGYMATDIVARYKRARGFNVLHPIGWDAFGLPAEQYAIQTGIHPAITTQKAIDQYRKQLKALGLSYDWSREISTCDPQYYRWTQFLFLKLYEKGLAYQKNVPVNWCPALKTVLANEEVVEGQSERGGHPVFRLLMKQWMLKITDYAERLLQGLDTLDWPESTKELQRHWIGRSEGLLIDFPVQESALNIQIFTTRPDTVFGVTYLVLAPEHPLVMECTTDAQRTEILAYQSQTAQKSEVARQEVTAQKTGVFTGTSALNPFTQKLIPIWISDYVLIGYGSGAIMAVPAHDERDAHFAEQFQLPIQTVIQKPIDGGAPVAGGLSSGCSGCYCGEGVLIHSGFATGLSSKEAQAVISNWVEKKGWGKRTIQYKLRDWLFSRQRYWGEPFPLVHLETGGVEALPAHELPVLLPDVQTYEPTGTGESPLASILDWVQTVNAQGSPARRETDTMPGSAGSSWYFLRYCDPHSMDAPWSAAAEKYWMPVDFYLGGPEHAVGHLLYARFWTQVLYDAGLVTHPEPFRKLIHQGMILGENGEKMSKSRGNVINPDDVIQAYGADTLRLYEMFLGPLEKDKPWSTTGIEGVHRFLQRAWRLFIDEKGQKRFAEISAAAPELKLLHQTIRKVTEDIENLRFNTALSQMMIFVNFMTALPLRPRVCLRPFIQLLNPFAPHLAEELWEILGEQSTLTEAPWPCFDPDQAQESKIKIAIQVMGKTRDFLEIEMGTEQSQIEQWAQQLPGIAKYLQGKTITKLIYVQGKVFNFVLS